MKLMKVTFFFFLFICFWEPPVFISFTSIKSAKPLHKNTPLQIVMDCMSNCMQVKIYKYIKNNTSNKVSLCKMTPVSFVYYYGYISYITI